MKAKKIIHVKEEGAKVLLIGDMAGYGKISLGAMIPIMSHMGFNLYNLPTALVSNTLDYGLFEILDTTDYMKNTLKVWKKLGFSFDAICTGLIVSEEQVKVVAEYCRQQQREGKRIFVDPIMGDDGVLYNLSLIHIYSRWSVGSQQNKAFFIEWISNVETCKTIWIFWILETC